MSQVISRRFSSFQAGSVDRYRAGNLVARQTAEPMPKPVAVHRLRALAGGQALVDDGVAILAKHQGSDIERPPEV